MTTLPPGPGKLAPLRMLFDLSRTIGDYAKQYGDPFTIPTVMGPLVTTVSPEGNKAIFSADPDTFVPAGGQAFGFVLGNSVLLSSGAEHRRARKLLMPPFHGARM
jgi:cytochrome P450